MKMATLRLNPSIWIKNGKIASRPKSVPAVSWGSGASDPSAFISRRGRATVRGPALVQTLRALRKAEKVTYAGEGATRQGGVGRTGAAASWAVWLNAGGGT